MKQTPPWIWFFSSRQALATFTMCKIRETMSDDPAGILGSPCLRLVITCGSLWTQKSQLNDLSQQCTGYGACLSHLPDHLPAARERHAGGRGRVWKAEPGAPCLLHLRLRGEPFLRALGNITHCRNAREANFDSTSNTTLLALCAGWCRCSKLQ